MPTIYTTRANRTISTNQYSVTEHFKPSNVMAGHNLPGVFFFYDLSPIKVGSQCPMATQVQVAACSAALDCSGAAAVVEALGCSSSANVTAQRHA